MKFYKIKNSNSSFEFEVEARLSRIEKVIKSKNSSLLCGVFSGIIAFYFQNKYAECNDILFVVLLLGGYLGLSLLVRACNIAWDKWLFGSFKKVWNSLLNINTEEEKGEKETKALFWNKIVNTVVQGISLVNRLDQIENNDDKKDLVPIYAMQAEYLFEYAAEMLKSSDILKKNEKGRQCIEAIGPDAVKWLFDEAIKYLERLQSKIKKENLSMDDTLKSINLTKQFYKKKPV